ncbi:hypothetical protein CISIN_1g017042mg [Citrus sinensis]|uniref:Glabrous enhancer-binding protein-like DBD domain-containing protein n=1 Tax=Citrus sinensis TaxID=2711 RepID=A0A067EDA9_CITSI|nr:hypothetical protein CISIN_1g017042mg [Citrus sinensis]
MAPKKPNPREEPPAASSSAEEEEEEEDDSSGSELEVSSSSSDDDGEEEEKDTQGQDHATTMLPKTQKQPALKKPEATAQTKAPSSESESESESGSEPGASPKPSEATKPTSSKRPNEAENKEAANAKDSKRAKKNGGADEELHKKEPGEDTKKQQPPPLFQRLWSEDDEIIVLKRMIEYSTEKGIDPSQDTQAFYDYVKNSLHGDYTKAQLMDKIRRLKKKCVNNLRKSAKKGGVRTFSNPHEQRAYDLSKKLWEGSEESTGGVMALSAAKSYKKNQSQRGNNELLAALKAELLGEEGAVGDKKGNAAVFFDKTLGVAGLEEFVLHDGFNMISGAKKAELEERWKNLQVAQLKLFLQRNELIKEQALLILEASRKTTQ